MYLNVECNLGGIPDKVSDIRVFSHELGSKLYSTDPVQQFV